MKSCRKAGEEYSLRLLAVSGTVEDIAAKIVSVIFIDEG